MNINVQDQTIPHEKFKFPRVDLCSTVIMLLNNYYRKQFPGKNSVIDVLGIFDSTFLKRIRFPPDAFSLPEHYQTT